nr:4'-phosphopantetheinyl transferase superfamily protein [Streptomyces sp. SID5785]
MPRDVCCAEAFGDLPGAVLLDEEERDFVHAGPGRRRQSTTVRHLARQALARLGHAPAPVPRGPGGAPHWPDGVVGSMTHCAGYRAAVVADGRRLAAVGIDAEPHAALREGTLATISLPRERRLLAERHEGDPSIHWDRLLFSAKEAVYKCWYPLSLTPLDFGDVDVVFRAEGGHFDASVHPGGPAPGASAAPRTFTGRWAVAHGLIITAVSAPPVTGRRA